MFARIPQWLLKSLQKVCIIIMYAPWCGIIRPPGCLAHGLVWAIDHCVRWGVMIPPREGASRRGVGFPIVKYRRSAPSRVLFDGKFHQAVAGWTVNLSGFIQICLSLSHVVVGLTVRSVRSARSGPFATRLSVCPSICHTHVLCSNDWTDQVALSCEGYHQGNHTEVGGSAPWLPHSNHWEFCILIVMLCQLARLTV